MSVAQNQSEQSEVNNHLEAIFRVVDVILKGTCNDGIFFIMLANIIDY